MNERIKPIVMPKWGLSMKEGKVTGWLVQPGAAVRTGDEILEVETEKIANVVESGDSGTLRRVIGEADTVYPVKALLGVIAEDDVPESEIDDFIASYVTAAADGDEEDEAGPTYEFVETPSGRLRYARRGSGGETVVLIHGFGGDLGNWLFNIDAIAAYATVYALDLPGHGQSTKTITDASVKGLAKTVLAFMDAVGIGKAHLVGHSLGGATALQAANDASDRVASLTLIDSAGLGPEINMDYIDGYIAGNSRKEMKPVLERLFADPALVSRQLIEDVLKFKRLDGVTTALRSLADGVFPDGKQSAVFASGGVRTLVIWGSRDNIIPAAHAANAEGARVEILEGSGHMAQMEQAERVNALIKEHLAG